MKTKNFRLVLLSMAVTAAATAVGLALVLLNDKIVYFYLPSEIDAAAQQADVIRIGGMVKKGSIVYPTEQQQALRFQITDTKTLVTVSFTGIAPSLFQEGTGAIVEGKFMADGIFKATQILAKHDENYMPPFVAEKLGRLP